MPDESAAESGQAIEQPEVRIKEVQCSLCDKRFYDAPVPQIAKELATHWNEDHDDELRVDMEPFKTEEYAGHHLHGDEYAYKLKEYYVTAYDILDTSGSSCGPFAYAYVREPESEDHCEDCWRSIQAVDGYRTLSTDGWRDKYLCDECDRQRDLRRRQENNQSLTEWSA